MQATKKEIISLNFLFTSSIRHMKKIIFVLTLFFLSISCLSQSTQQVGVSTYIYPASLGFRWAKVNHVSDAIYTKTAFEFRTTFIASFSGEGNVVGLQPELNALHCIHHETNISFMSGLGLAYGYQNENDNYFGAYIPLVTEFYPNFFNHALSVKIEGDVFMKRYPNFTSLNFRPLVGVVYNFGRKIKLVDATQ